MTSIMEPARKACVNLRLSTWGGGGGGMQAGYFIVIAVPVYSGNQPLVENYIIS